ncbi:MAG TPA: ATP-dependent zinc metalloprotease FtsH [Spirochaetota bacterium]|nr:ATP-dependent zinc metalloprotease FtsH [Spirochaetota bacterium]
MASDQDKKNNKNNNNNKNKNDFLQDLEKKLKSRKDKEKKDDKQKNKNTPGRFSLFLILGLIIFTIYMLVNSGNNQQQVKEASYTDFYNNVVNDVITECIFIRNKNIIRYTINKQKYETKIPYQDESLLALLRKHDVKIDSKDEERSVFVESLIQLLPWILIMGVIWFFLMRQLRGRMGGGMNFGKSRAKLINREQVKERFTDVKGCEEAKEDMEDVIAFLKNPQKFSRIGARVPKGVLLVGPPGTGKTLIAKAVAGEAKVPFFSMSGSDFVEMFVGVGASRVRDLFNTGKKNAPCILFIDEIDAVGRTRGAGYGGGHDEREQTLNQMLVEMDGFDTNSGVILVAATNRPDVLDKALLRPGRFDRQIIIDNPDVKGRKAILEVHAKKIKLENKTSLDAIAQGTPGFTGADLANIINEAALIAAKENKKKVNEQHLEAAKDKVIMGVERKSILIHEDEKKTSAFHEAGHTLTGLLLERADIFHKVSIIPRSRTLGQTSFLPEDGRHTISREKILTNIKVLYGGRVAEELVFNDITNGAANDIERATKLVKAMVCEWGMSSLGPVTWGEKEQPVFIAKEISRRDEVSPEYARKIDNEIYQILTQSYESVKQMLQSNIKKLKLLANTLLEKETLTVDEVCKLLKIKKPTGKKFLSSVS